MKKIELGKFFEFKSVFNDEEVALFASLSKDNNPIHLDDDYAKQSVFGRKVVHGVLVMSMFSKIFGTLYPGEGTIYLSQSAKFIKPAYVGDVLTAKVTLNDFEPTRRIGIFLTESFNSEGKLILSGEAKVLFPDTYFFERQ